jgi:hypothetical protein
MQIEREIHSQYASVFGWELASCTVILIRLNKLAAGVYSSIRACEYPLLSLQLIIIDK